MHISQAQFDQDLIQFLKYSPTPFHAVRSMATRLEAAGFTRLYEQDGWQLTSSNSYYVIRNASSIIAFTTGKGKLARSGFRMVGAHTDSPSLKIKPAPVRKVNDYFQLEVEVYGGVLLNPWFDRDLSLAGRVTWLDKTGSIKSTLIDFEEPIAFIPSLAIHLDSSANKERTINPEEHLPVIIANLKCDHDCDFNKLLEKQIQTQIQKQSSEKVELVDIGVLAFDLYLYDCQAPNFVGLEKEFLVSARLDNLLSCFIGLQSLLASRSNHPCLIVCNDHEEVGSESVSGAGGNFLEAVLERVIGQGEPMAQAMRQSTFFSTDNAHAVHPNYPSKHNKNHGPVMNAGPVIKVNANQKYATCSETYARFCRLCEEVNCAFQVFAARADAGCGSTIGPITAAKLGVSVLDLGLPTLGMHSIREMAGRNDPYQLSKVLLHFFNSDFANIEQPF